MRGDGRLVGGRYRLESVLGSGGMGTVWRAEDQLLARPVAVKEIRFSAYATPLERATLVKDTVDAARAAADLDHPNIVAVHDVVPDDDQVWLVLSLVEGRSLAQLVRDEGPLPEAEVRRIGLAVLDALDAAHEADILHRDVKPSNVMMGTDGRVALSDFSTGTSTGTVTRTGILLGSPGYLAPERLHNGAASVAGDLYGLGATLYYAAEGRGPYDGRNLFAAVTETPTPIAATGPLAEVINGLLAREPQDRLTSAAARALLGGVAALPAAPRPTLPAPDADAPVSEAAPLAEADPPAEAPSPEEAPSPVEAAPVPPPDPMVDTVNLDPLPLTAEKNPVVPEEVRPIWDAPTDGQSLVDEDEEGRPGKRNGILFLVGILVLAVLIGGGVVLRDTGNPQVATPTPTRGVEQPAPVPAPETDAPATTAAPTSAPPTSAAPTTPPAGRVTSARISTTIDGDAFPCRYSATASVTVSGPTTVRYRVVSDQNGSSATLSATFTKAGSRTLTAPRNQNHLAGPGWVELRILSPTPMTRRANFSLPAFCTAVDVSLTLARTSYRGNCVFEPGWAAEIRFTARYAPTTFTYVLWRDGERVFSDTVTATQPNQAVTEDLSWRSRDPGQYHVTIDGPASGTSNRVPVTVECT